MENDKCYVCDWISRIDEDENKYFIAELETGYVFLSSKWQYFKGYTFFVSKMCIGELHLMPIDFRKAFLFEMTIVSEAVKNTFNPIKINCESLGNSCSHAHWHIIPRYGSDPYPDKSIWNIERTIIESIVLEDNELMKMQKALIAEMKELVLNYKITAIFKS